MQALADRVAAGEEAYTPAQAVELAAAPVADAAETGVGHGRGDAAAAEAREPIAPPARSMRVLLEILDAEVAGHLQTVDAWLAEAHDAPARAATRLLRAIHTMNGAFAMTEVPAITDAHRRPRKPTSSACWLRRPKPRRRRRGARRAGRGDPRHDGRPARRDAARADLRAARRAPGRAARQPARSRSAAAPGRRAGGRRSGCAGGCGTRAGRTRTHRPRSQRVRRSCRDRGGRGGRRHRAHRSGASCRRTGRSRAPRCRACGSRPSRSGASGSGTRRSGASCR